MEKIIRESAFDEKKKKPGLKFNHRLALTGFRTTGAWCFTITVEEGFLKLPREIEIGSKNQWEYIRKIKGCMESHLF